MLRTIKTSAGSVGIVHTIDSYHHDWADICEGLRVGAGRERAQRTRESFSGMGPDSGLLWGRSDVEREHRNAHDLPDTVRNIDLVITGHTPGATARWTRRNVLCVDTGVHVHDAAYGHLTVAEIGAAEPQLHRFSRAEGE